ncbi:MAG: DsrE family protein [Acetobacter sp.]|uniref:DsrE family protein n=1 Tax=Acetobacter sp. TaxID=440 RepID=UPI003F8FCEA3
MSISTGSRTPPVSFPAHPAQPPVGVSGLSVAIPQGDAGGCELAIMIVEARYERLHAAFMLAVTACALGQQVVLFGMGAGVAAFCKNWDGLEQPERDAARQEAGIAGLDDLRTALLDFEEATLMVCDSGLKAVRLTEEALVADVSCVGLPTFLDQTQTARLAVF